MFVMALKHFKCDELTRALFWSQPNVDAFDHFSMMKVTETVGGCGNPPVPHAKDSALQPVLGHATGQKHHVRAQEHDRGQMMSNGHSAAAAAAEGVHSVHLRRPSLLLLSVCCSSFVHDHALVHEHDVFGL